MESSATGVRATLELGLIVVDYIQLVRGQRRGGDSREVEVSQVSADLTRLAGEFDVPVLALSQLNRSVETRGTKDKRPQLSDLRRAARLSRTRTRWRFSIVTNTTIERRRNVASPSYCCEEPEWPNGHCEVRFCSPIHPVSGAFRTGV